MQDRGAGQDAQEALEQRVEEPSPVQLVGHHFPLSTLVVQLLILDLLLLACVWRQLHILLDLDEVPRRDLFFPSVELGRPLVELPHILLYFVAPIAALVLASGACQVVGYDTSPYIEELSPFTGTWGRSPWSGASFV